MVLHAPRDDRDLLELIGRRREVTIQQLIESLGVTANAVRQRLNRLMAEGLLCRKAVRQVRGRPFHLYALTEQAEQLLGNNYTDLAISLWGEMKQIKDPAVRRALTRRVCDALVAKYGAQIHGDTLDERLAGLKQVLAERGVDVEIDQRGALPILRENDCPYPGLAAADRGICALEKQVFARVLQSGVKLSRCRLDGHNCCEFETREKLAKVNAS